VQILTLALILLIRFGSLTSIPLPRFSFRQFLAKSDESFAEKLLNHFAAKQCGYQPEHLTAQIK